MKNESIWDSHPFFGGTWNNISRNKPRTGGSTSNTLTGQETCAKSCCKCFSLSATGTCNVLYVFGTHESANIFGKQFIFLGVSVIYYIVLSQHFLSYCCGFVDHVATLKSLEKKLGGISKTYLKLFKALCSILFSALAVFA